MLSHGPGRIWIIHKSQTRKELYPTRGQIHLRDQIPILVLDHPGRNPTNLVQLISDRHPTIMNPVLLEFGTNQMGGMVRQYRDEQMSFNAFILAVINGS